MPEARRINPPLAMRRTGSGCLPASICAVLFAGGCLILGFFFVQPISQIIAAQRWRAVPATIVISRPDLVESQAAPSKPESWRPLIRYRYTVDGASFHSTRIWFLKPDLDTRQQIERQVARWPEGSVVTAYVDPADPSSAVLERGFRPQLLIAIFPLLLVIVGGAALASIILRRLPIPPLWRLIHLPALFAHHRAQGAVTLRPHAGIRPLAAVLLSTLLYNALLWFLVREVIIDWSHGPPACHGLLLTVFTLPLVFLGLALIALSFVMLMRMTGPRPTLRLAAGQVPLGGSIDIAWRILGRRRRLRRLRLFVEGREEVIFPRAGREYAASEPFGMVPLVDTTDRNAIAGGRTTLRIPPQTMPTFDAGHGRILWVLCLHGEISRWAAVREEYELTVLPPAAPESASASSRWSQAGEEPQ